MDCRRRKSRVVVIRVNILRHASFLYFLAYSNPRLQFRRPVDNRLVPRRSQRLDSYPISKQSNVGKVRGNRIKLLKNFWPRHVVMPRLKCERDIVFAQKIQEPRFIWRRGGDSNPRSRFCRDNCLAGSPVRPLQHLSAEISNGFKCGGLRREV